MSQYESVKAQANEMGNTIQNEMRIKITTYEQNITIFRQENDDLKRRINEYENRIALLSQ